MKQKKLSSIGIMTIFKKSTNYVFNCVIFYILLTSLVSKVNEKKILLN